MNSGTAIQPPPLPELREARRSKSCQPPNLGKMQKLLAQFLWIWWLAPFLLFSHERRSILLGVASSLARRDRRHK